MSNHHKESKIKPMEYVSTLPRYFQRLPKSINRLPRYILLSVLIHFVFTLFSGLVIGVSSYRHVPISVSLIIDKIAPNEDMPAGEIVDSSAEKLEEAPSDATMLAAINSRTKTKGNEKLKTGEKEQVPIERIRLSGRDAEKEIKVKKAGTKLPDKRVSPEVKEVEKKVSDNFQDAFGTSRFTVEKREPKADVKNIKESRKSAVSPVVDLEQGHKNPLVDDEQAGVPLLKGADVDIMIKNNRHAFYETGDEAVVSLNTKRFKYASYFLEIRKAIEAV